MTQLSFYDRFTPHDDALPRLNRQCRAILDRLAEGTATNRQLADISLNYTARISDLKRAGYDIQCISQDRRTGLAIYEWRR